MNDKSVESWCEDDQYSYAGLLELIRSRAGRRLEQLGEEGSESLSVYIALQASSVREANIAPSSELRALAWRLRQDARVMYQCAGALEADAIEIERRGI